jgi:hypothetical protein
MSIRVFFSGTPSMTAGQKYQLGTLIKRRLNSCHGDYLREALLWGDIISRPESTIEEWMLDSGAFTAWSRGDTITLASVIQNYERALSIQKKDIPVWLINLDVIPGKRGKDPSSEEIHHAMRQSDKNFLTLVNHFGHRVLPVFHQGESQSRLEEVRQQSNYIGISPRNDLPENARVRWSAQVHDSLGSTHSHGLAATGAAMLRQVPWWSVDSASWLYSAAMGGIDLLVEGKLVTIGMSTRNAGRYCLDAHFDTLSEQHRTVVLERIHQYGLSVDGLRETANERVFFCIRENQRWVDDLLCAPVLQETLFPL